MRVTLEDKIVPFSQVLCRGLGFGVSSHVEVDYPLEIRVGHELFSAAIEVEFDRFSREVEVDDNQHDDLEKVMVLRELGYPSFQETLLLDRDAVSRVVLDYLGQTMLEGLFSRNSNVDCLCVVTSLSDVAVGSEEVVIAGRGIWMRSRAWK